MKPKIKYNATYIRTHGERVRIVDSRIPRSLDQYSLKSGNEKKIYLICNKIIHNTLRCEFSVRKDVFIESPLKYAEHKCFAGNIENYFHHEEQYQNLDDVTKSLINFIGTAKLPMNTLSSDSFKKFMASLVKLGQSNPTAHIQQLVPSIPRKTFTKHFIQTSNEIFNEKLKKYVDAKGTCIAIDAGKHKSIPYLMVMLINALLNTKPLLVDAVRFFKGKSIDYASTVEEILASLQAKGIRIVAIISDNLKSQVAAINHTSPHSFQQKTTNPSLASIIWISCSVHTLALALNDSAGQCAYGKLIEHLRSSAKFFRNKNIVNLFGIKCPMWAPTRWTGMFDIAFWMLKNNDKITSVIEESLTNEAAYDFPDFVIEGFTSAAAVTFTVLLPFYHATHILEADNIPAAYTPPVISEAVKQMRANCESTNINSSICECIASCIENRLKLSQSGRILQLLYSLTPWGRKELREKGILEVSGKDNVELECPFINALSPAEESMMQKLKDQPDFFVDRANHLKALFNEFKGKLINASNSRKVNEHEGYPDYDEEEEFIKITDDHLNFLEANVDSTDDEDDDDSSSCSTSSEEEEDFDLAEDDVTTITNGPLQDNVSTIKELATLQGYNEEEICAIITQYGDWLLEDPSISLVHEEHLKKGCKCWQYYVSYKGLEKLAKFALPLMGIAASEACCERAFWQHRRVIGDHGMKTGRALEKAKLVFSIK